MTRWQYAWLTDQPAALGFSHPQVGLANELAAVLGPGVYLAQATEWSIGIDRSRVNLGYLAGLLGDRGWEMFDISTQTQAGMAPGQVTIRTSWYFKRPAPESPASGQIVAATAASTAPAPPEMTTPAAPAAWAAPAAPEMATPATPAWSAPAAPAAPEMTPEVAAAVSALGPEPATQAAPEMPAMPEPPVMPEMPAMPEAPVMPEMPAMPEPPTTPAWPEPPKPPEG